MKNPLILLIRKIALFANRSKEDHRILPLKSIKRVAVLYDPSQGDSASLSSDLINFFSHHNISLVQLRIDKTSVGIAGYIKHKIRKQNVLARGDMFISLISDPECFASEYESKCTGAEFRIGCSPLGEEVYDLYMCIHPSMTISQSEMFEKIKEVLVKIV